MIKPSRLALLALVLTCAGLGWAADTKQSYRPDPWITTKTKIALLTDNDVAGTRVNVDTVGGRVTLHGNVATAAQKSQAEQVARKIEGVVEVRNLLQVVPESARKVAKLEDEAIAKNVKAAFEKDPALKDGKINVKSVNKGVVLLAGEASSLTSHLRAIRVANGVDGVNRVSSEVRSPDTLADLEVREYEVDAQSPPHDTDKSVASTFSDAWITTASKVRLMADDDTPAMEINVDTDDGVVTLFGIVPTNEAKQDAASQVSKVAGVKKVENNLQVVAPAAQKAVEIKDEDAVKAARDVLGKVDAYDDVNIEVKNGVARLTGTVDTQSDWLMAAVAVRGSRGIRSVNNDLKVDHD